MYRMIPMAPRQSSLPTCGMICVILILQEIKSYLQGFNTIISARHPSMYHLPSTIHPQHTLPPFPPPTLPPPRLPRFPGASDEAIMRTVEVALGLPRGTPAVIRDPEDGSIVTVSDSLPDGLSLDATRSEAGMAPFATAVLGGSGGGSSCSSKQSGRSRSPTAFDRHKSEGGGGFYGGTESGNHSNLKGVDVGSSSGGSTATSGNARDGGGSGGGEAAGGAAQEFRGELLKFERVNAHLANERTWLAWVRTALSVLGVALSLVSLTADMGSTLTDSTALAVGVAFVACTLFTYLTGWLRYARVKQVLSWTGTQVKGSFGRFGLQYFTWFLGVALVLTVPIYLTAGVNVVKAA